MNAVYARVAYIITSIGFYLISLVLLASRHVKSALHRAPSTDGHPNNGVQRTGTARSLGGEYRARRRIVPVC